MSEYEELKDNIVSGLFTTESVDGTAQLTGKALGKAEQLRDIIEIFDDIAED